MLARVGAHVDCLNLALRRVLDATAGAEGDVVPTLVDGDRVEGADVKVRGKCGEFGRGGHAEREHSDCKRRHRARSRQPVGARRKGRNRVAESVALSGGPAVFLSLTDGGVLSATGVSDTVRLNST